MIGSLRGFHLLCWCELLLWFWFYDTQLKTALIILFEILAIITNPNDEILIRIQLKNSPFYLVNKPLQAAGMSADNVRG